MTAAAGQRRVAGLGRRQRFFEMPRRQQVDAAFAARPRAVRMAPQFMTPVDNIAFVIERCIEPDHHRRAERLPREFIFAHPLHAHRLAGDCARQQHGVERDVVGGVVAVTARAFGVGDDDVALGKTQHLRHVDAQRVNALTVRPDPHLAAVFAISLFALAPRRQRAGRRERGVGQVRFGVFGVELFRTCSRRITLGIDDFGFSLRLQRQQMARIIGRQLGAVGPLRDARKAAFGAYRLLFALGDHAEK